MDIIDCAYHHNYSQLLMAKTITGPIQQLIAKTKAVSAGDLTVHAESKSKDEVGILTRDFNLMVENMKEMVEQVRISSGRYLIPLSN